MKSLVLLCICVSLSWGHHEPMNLIPEVRKDVLQNSGQMWPLPQHYVSESTYFTIQPEKFLFVLSTLPNCDILLEAAQRYQNIIFSKDCSGATQEKNRESPGLDNGHNGQLLNLTIKVSGACEKYPYMDMDEQYLLKINDPDLPNEALLFSSTVWGALRGLETFSQLVYQIQPGVFAVNTSTTLDFPRFSFRGLLLDTSRHFVPVSVLLQNLDAMAQAKLNVFHWHIVDDPSFPYVSKKFPEMSEKGAFNPQTHVYSQKDVAQVIEFARLRGIRVLAEFDTPGHTLSWGKSQPDILTPCYDKKGPIPGKYGPVDPTKEETYTFLQKLFSEVAEVFPDGYIHLGGDEVSFTCWKSNPVVQAFMKAHKFGSDYSQLEGYYLQRLLTIIKSLKKSYIVWQEVFDNGVKVKPDTVIHVWKDGYKSELTNVTSMGLKTILSSCWYLNEISYGPDWIKYYGCDPQDFNGTASQKNLVIGGEACMWGEFVDGSNLISRTWPRAAVVGERLWSDKSVTNPLKAVPRLEALRCRMIKRGLKVEPVNGPGYCDCDYLP